MNETLNNAMPFAECPHCGKETQLDDWYEFKVGDERECPNCRGAMYVTNVEAIMYVAFGTEKHQ